MAASLNTGIAPSCFFRTNKLALKPRPVRCSRKHESSASFTSEPSQLELNEQSLDMLQESLVSTSNSRSDKNSDIWKIFNDAQRNILYLNKRRIAAIEELKKCQTENALLLARIEELEAGTKASGVKGSIAKLDYLSIKCDLLLRIDSMVLSGLIGAVESSDLRRLVTHSSYSLLDALCDIQQKKDLELLISLRQYSDESKRKGLHVVHICSEMAPVVSHGSLASYVTGLSRAVQRKGNLVEVILPKYSTLALDEVWGLRKVEAEFLSYFDGDWHANRIWTGVVYGIGVTFIEPVYYSSYFNRERICGYLDDFERFTYFSRASLDYLVKAGKQPDVLHIHNWETAIVGPLFWDIFVNQGLGGTRILFTCHGFNSQCLENPEKLALCGLDPPRLHRPDRLQDNIKTHLVNILKGGVVYSNKVVVISSIHSKDKIIHTLSRGLESTLAIHKEKLVVAPYGFDDTIWDPSKDNLLPAKYYVDNIRGKAICKTVLRQHLGLYGEASTVIVGSIYSELPDVDLENLKAAVSVALSKGAQLVFMDTSKIQSLHAALEPCEDFKDENVRFLNKDDKDSLHLLFAGSDIILCPSFHDPVQQVPLKALKYGAAPIAITFNSNGFSRPEENHFGSTNLSYYIISTYTNMSLSQALDQIKNDPSGWNKRMKEGMAKDFSWDSECCDIHSAAYMSIKN